LFGPDAGYDQIAAIYALEVSQNDVNKAIKMLAEFGMESEDPDGRSKDQTQKTSSDTSNEKDNLISAMGNHLQSSKRVAKEKGKEKLNNGNAHRQASTNQDKVKSNNFLATFMYYILSRIRNCMNFCIMCDVRLISR